MAGETIGVLLMAYGSPNSLDEVEAYFTHVHGGITPPPERIEELKERYRAIGGRSPLLEITRRQAQALEAKLNEAAGTQRFRVYAGMKHWHPFIAETIDSMAQEGIRRAVALALAPHYSRLSIGGYVQAVKDAVEKLSSPIEVMYMESWHLEPLFLKALADHVTAALQRFPGDIRDRVPVVFTAHSLPERILQWKDPYPIQLIESCQAVARLGGLQQWHFAYQSVSPSREPWLGPEVPEVLSELRQQGHQAVLICPIGFVSDHLEILYDIDIGFKRHATALGMQLERTESLNDGPQFIAALAAIVQGRLFSELAPSKTE